MELLCKSCLQWFIPEDDSIEMISGGFINADSVNMCCDCWDMFQLAEFDFSESYIDDDLGL